MMQFLCTVALFLVTVKANDEWAISYPFFGSRTAYKSVSPGKIKIPDGFTPRQVILLARHGTRTPKLGLSKDMLPKLNEYKTKITKDATLGDDAIQAIKDWVTNIDDTQNRELTQKGHIEMKELAIKVREAFPDLFKQQYSSGNYEILTMPESRCALAAQSFLQTFFEDETITEIPKCDLNDILLSIDTMMEADPKFEEYRTYYWSQAKEFAESIHMAGVVQNVAAKLGIDSKELNTEMITTMYEVSAYEYANDDSAVPPWYSVFSQEDLEVLEYAWDIPWSHVIGYGNPHNKKLVCPMAIRLEERLKRKINGEGPNGVFYIACEKNIMIMLFILGLGDGDLPFTASNYKGMKDLNWRSSHYGPWTANFITVLLEDAQNDHYVAFYFNEKPTSMKLIDGSSCTVCRWSDIQDKLSAFITGNDCVNFVANVTIQNYKDNNLYWYFSTKTTYELDSAKEIFIPPYKPILIFTVNSHSAASLTRNFTNKLLPLLENLKGKIAEKEKMSQLDDQAIMNWLQSIKNQLNDKVSIRKSHDEIKDLAIKVRKAFPELFGKSDNYQAMIIGEEHCKEPGIAFLQNVYGDTNITDIPNNNNDDFFLVIKSIIKPNNDKEAEYESKEFKKGDYMKNVVERVKVKLGSDDITNDEVMIMFEACRYDTFNYESNPLWCSVFCQEDVEVLEYVDELRLYYAYGYGKPLNLKLACPLATRLLKTLEDKIDNKEGPDGVFHFADRYNVLSLHVMLGLFKDDSPLTSSNFNEMKNRQWKSSMFGPWSANFMAVLFENAKDDYKVAFYFNEHITSIPLGNGTSCTECPWSDIKNKLQAYISDNDCVNYMAENLAIFKKINHLI